MRDPIERQDAIDAYILHTMDYLVGEKPRRAFTEVLRKLPSAQQWIPCSERLPKQQQTVLIQDFGQITIGYLNAENRWRDLTNLDDYLKGVVAWMPLPEPYAERREE